MQPPPVPESVNTAEPSGTDTPMMRQYLDLKAQAGEALLLYRMGDFYECFFEDAVQAAQILELTLTSRNKNDPQPIPMAGIPYHALDAYLPRLLEAGVRVALAEQVEDPAAMRARGEKLVARELVRVISPGVPFSPDAVEARERCWLAGLAPAQGAGGRGEGSALGLAFLDVSTGSLRATEVADLETALRELSAQDPRELLLHPDLASEPLIASRLSGVARARPDAAIFEAQAAQRRLCEVLGVADLEGFGAAAFSGAGVAVAGALVAWVRDQARLDLRHVQTLELYRVGGCMVLDEATRRNLEILRPLWGSGRKGTLLGHLDRSCTAMGARLLRDWLGAPLLDPAAIHTRQEAVELLLTARLRRELREGLRQVADLERLGTKVAQGTASARDLVALRLSLAAMPAIARLVGEQPALLLGRPEDLLLDVHDDIGTWLVDEPPLALREGGIIRRGVHAELDELTDLAREGKGAIAAIEERERRRTGISSLKIRHNRVFGYFLEVTQANLDRVPADWMRKQTLANAERYFTAELKEFEDKVMGADERRVDLEYEIFVELRSRVARQLSRLTELAARVAWLDTVTALAEVAAVGRYCRPIVDDSARLELIACRHPVVEAMPMEEAFVPNDLVLDEQRRLVVLTGPNMAGKSTVMRQVALCVLMAQIGAFVPAASAHVGVCDRIFVRVGASDDLAHGRSTFMVEMSETALILNQASARSLLLLDEIGRGTSTYDGLSIAWAVAEAVHDRIKARAIFATHYHEMNALAEDRPGVLNMHIAVSEWGERIIFLRRLEPGGASKSYGIQCARLAGMPASVVERARALLVELEKRPRQGPPGKQLGLFTPAPPPPPPSTPASNPLREALAGVDPDSLSPRQAHELLYRLVKLTQAAPG